MQREEQGMQTAIPPGSHTATLAYFNPMDPDMLRSLQTTWVGGPTHSVQDQHIPSYKGHIHGLKSENLFGKTYSKLTAESFKNRDETVYKGVHETDYRSIYKENFDYPRKQAAVFTGDTNVNVNPNKYQTEVPLKEEFVCPDPDRIAPIDRVPIVGYQGYVPTFLDPLRKFKRIEEIKKQYDEGWRPTVPENAVKDLSELEVPAVGYTGFVKGKKAENVYGKTFQRTAMESLIKVKNDLVKAKASQ